MSPEIQPYTEDVCLVVAQNKLLWMLFGIFHGPSPVSLRRPYSLVVLVEDIA